MGQRRSVTQRDDELMLQVRVFEEVVQTMAEGLVVADETGAFVVFNPAAERLLGFGPADAGPAGWPSGLGLFQADGTTPFPLLDLPLARAIRGERADDVELLVRSPRAPEGVLLRGHARPLRDAGGNLKGGVVTFSDITELRKTQRELARLAITDELTQIPNHRAFRQRLCQLVKEGERDRKFALVMIDIDHFKDLNDAHGHLEGDRMLTAVARTLAASIRKTDHLSRYGGEEFCVMFVDVDGDTACALAENLRAAVAAIDGPLRVTASFGICSYSRDFKGDVDSIIRRADEALYRAKRAGRNCVMGT